MLSESAKQFWQNLQFHSANCQRPHHQVAVALPDLWVDLLMSLEDEGQADWTELAHCLSEVPFDVQQQFMNELVESGCYVFKSSVPEHEGNLTNIAIPLVVDGSMRLLVGQLYDSVDSQTLDNYLKGIFEDCDRGVAGSQFHGPYDSCLVISLDVQRKKSPQIRQLRRRDFEVLA